MRSISITLIIALTVFTLAPSASAGETTTGYYVLAGLCAAGAYGCYEVFKNCKECNKDYAYNDASEEARECERRTILKWGAAGAGVGLLFGVVALIGQAQEVSRRNSNGLLNFSIDGKSNFNLPDISVNPATGGTWVTLLRMSF